ncbi:MAG: cold-shock protein [Gammaproteobacteria bacterium]|jgi:CspA family cold shock protein|nr:cold-shock protein [Gammaproteobacteria bacterium]
MGDREVGIVKWFNNARGFGFIQREDGEDVFVHYRSIQGEGYKTLDEGQRVEYQMVSSDKGLQAEEVTALEA